MTQLQSGAAGLVIVALTVAIVLADASLPASDPGDPGFSLDSPVGGSLVDFPVDGFDLCSSFSYVVFLEWAPAEQAPVERGRGSCRWHGEGATATITDETGPTLAEISHNPRYRPGYAGVIDGNVFWSTGSPTSPPYVTDLFLAVGPAQPRRLLHISVELEAERAPSPQPNTSYTARGLAQLIARSTAGRLFAVRLATTVPTPR